MNISAPKIARLGINLMCCLLLVLPSVSCSGELDDDDLISIYSQYDSSWGGIAYTSGGYARAKKEKLEQACRDHGFTVEEFFQKYNNGGEEVLRRHYQRKYRTRVLRELPGYRYSGPGYHK